MADRAPPQSLVVQSKSLDGQESVMRSDKFRGFEGRQVSLSLVSGSRIDDCQMVSAARGPSENIWVFSNGVDRFLALSEVVDCWEAPPGDAA